MHRPSNVSGSADPSLTVVLVRRRISTRKTALILSIFSIAGALCCLLAMQNIHSSDADSLSSASSTEAAAQCCGQCSKAYGQSDPTSIGVLRCCDACTHAYFPGLWWDGVHRAFHTALFPPPSSQLYSTPAPQPGFAYQIQLPPPAPVAQYASPLPYAPTPPF
mmetsp:Transcript_29935/g.62741  ORF Transcript_29935/g.62741 Transcript_29935/m.62741 type:complete len:163 (-) Transcript_29935:13-501(-)